MEKDFFFNFSKNMLVEMSIIFFFFRFFLFSYSSIK